MFAPARKYGQLLVACLFFLYLGGVLRAPILEGLHFFAHFIHHEHTSAHHHFHAHSGGENHHHHFLDAAGKLLILFSAQNTTAPKEDKTEPIRKILAAHLCMSASLCAVSGAYPPWPNGNAALRPLFHPSVPTPPPKPSLRILF